LIKKKKERSVLTSKMFGFKPSAAKIAKKETAVTRREANRYEHQANLKTQECATLKRALDINTKKGNMVEARKIAAKIADLESEIQQLNNCVQNMRKAQQATERLQLVASQARAQQSVLKANAAVLRTVDAREIEKTKYQTEQQKDQIDMMTESLEEIFEPDHETEEAAASRVDELLMISMEKNTLEGMLPSASTHVPSIVHTEQVQQSPLLASSAPPPSYLPTSSPSSSSTPPSSQPKITPSFSELEERMKDVFGSNEEE
jgi:hypothetical protein